MLKKEEVKQRFHEVCLVGGKYLCLFSGEENCREMASAKIVGPKSDLEAWFAVIGDVGRGCVAILELPVPEKINLRLLGEFCLLYVNALIKQFNTVPGDQSSRESVMSKHLESIGAISSITNSLDRTFLPVYLPQQV